MADEQDVPPFVDQPFGLTMHLGDQRAGRVHELQSSVARVRRNGFGHSMS